MHHYERYKTSWIEIFGHDFMQISHKRLFYISCFLTSLHSAGNL